MSYVIAYQQPKPMSSAACGVQFLIRIAAVLAALFVTYASLTPTVSMPNVTHFDKVMHLVAYAGLGGLFMLSWRASGWVKIGITVTALGIAIEIAQSAMRLGRTGSLLDVIANVAGVIIGITAVLTVLRLARRSGYVS